MSTRRSVDGFGINVDPLVPHPSRARPADDRETKRIDGLDRVGTRCAETGTDLRIRLLTCGAGDGNRTRTTSLEGWSSTIELRPRLGQA